MKKMATKIILMALTLWVMNLFVPGVIFAQGYLDFYDAGQRFLDYQFERADREQTSAGWMEQARMGISSTRALWFELMPDLLDNPDEMEKLNRWTDRELESRFTRWLLDRFFGNGIEIQTAGIFRETSQSDRLLIYHTGPDGSILYDPRTGDPRIIRPGDEEFNFEDNLQTWRQVSYRAAERGLEQYEYLVLQSYPELLSYVWSGREAEFESLIKEAGERAVESLQTEFLAILLREERNFAAQRLGDVWSLRQKSENQSAQAITDRLLEEARQASADSISAIETIIVAAQGEGAELLLSGTQWLEEYREQFYRGLRAWESAEERFILRRLEWEYSAEEAFRDGWDSWSLTLAKFDEERQIWEEQARILYLEGEQFFYQATMTLEKAILEARAELERDSLTRLEAASERAGALTNMFILSSSAAEEARKNVDFWTQRYNEYNVGRVVPKLGEGLEIWVVYELSKMDGAGRGLEKLILDELLTWTNLYNTYIAKAEDTQERLQKELASLSGLWDYPEGIQNPSSYEAELLRLEAELEYWVKSSLLAETVLAYAEAVDAGRVTASESAAAWDEALARYNEMIYLYDQAEARLQEAGASIAETRVSLELRAAQMKAADAILEQLRLEYQVFAGTLGREWSILISDEKNQYEDELAKIRESLNDIGPGSPWGQYMIHSQAIDELYYDELRREILRILITGEDDISIRDLHINAQANFNIIDVPLYQVISQMASNRTLSDTQRNVIRTKMQEYYNIPDDLLLEFRKAEITLILERNSFFTWRSTVYNNAKTDMNSAVFSTIEEQLLFDWEMNTLELLSAKMDLEIQALNALDNKSSTQEGMVLSAFLNIQRSEIPSIRIELEKAQAFLQSLMESKKLNARTGDLYLLYEDNGYDTNIILAYLDNETYTNSVYGGDIVQFYLNDLVKKIDFSGGLINVYNNFWIFSPVGQRQSIEEGYGFLAQLWYTLGVFDNDRFFPGTAQLLEALKDPEGNLTENLEMLCINMEHILSAFPSWVYLAYEEWKRSLQVYLVVPSEDYLEDAERFSARLNAALVLLTQNKLYNTAHTFEGRASQHVSTPNRNWNELAQISGADRIREQYEEALIELMIQESLESQVLAKIEELTEKLLEADKDLMAKRDEVDKRLDIIAKAETESNKLSQAYQQAAEDFLEAGLWYDTLFTEAVDAFNALEAARMEFEAQDALRQWAASAYLDWRKPAEELEYALQQRDRVQALITMMQELDQGHWNDEYALARYDYEESIHAHTLTLHALYSFQEALYDEYETNKFSYQAYFNQMVKFGYSYSFSEDYVSPESRSQWTILDMIRVNANGFLEFSTGSNRVIQGQTEESSALLHEYFLQNMTEGDERYLVSQFELAQRELAEWISENIKTRKDYDDFAYARDYMIRTLLDSNPGLGGTGGWLNYAWGLRGGTATGDRYIYWPGNQSVSSLVGNMLPYLHDIQQNRWNSFDTYSKKIIEVYTILTLLGMGAENSRYFSQISVLHEYTLVRNFASQSYYHFKEIIDKTIINGKINHGKQLEEMDNLWQTVGGVRRQIDDQLTDSLLNLKTTTHIIGKAYDAYQASSEKLAIMEGVNSDTIDWAVIERAFEAAGVFSEDLEGLRLLWEDHADLITQYSPDVLSALNLLAGIYAAERNEKAALLSHTWSSGEEERLHNEISYRDLFDYYMEGLISLQDLMDAASISFNNNVPDKRDYLQDLGMLINDTLLSYRQRSISGTNEAASLAAELFQITMLAWEGKYQWEIQAREHEWSLQYKDIQEKLALWRETAGIILEQGRIAWDDGEEKLIAAQGRWVLSFQEEYERIYDGWTAAYLEGLSEKDVWAASALEAAQGASSAAMIALMGSNAEAGGRAFDTRDPLSYMNLPDVKEGEKILSELLARSGTESLQNAFTAIQGSRETMASIVRTGLSGSGLWNSALIAAEASIFARNVNSDFEARESGRMAYLVLSSAQDAYQMLQEHVRQANNNIRNSMNETFVMEGHWSLAANWYRKEIIVHSTFFDPVITDNASVAGYHNYILPHSRLAAYLDGDIPQNMDVLDMHTYMDLIDTELKTMLSRVFGEDSNEGEFTAHVGLGPRIRASPDLDQGRSGVIEHYGTGETGRLLVEFYYWMFMEKQGLSMMGLAPWDKPMWDSRDSKLQAPTMRSAADLVIKTGIAITGIAGSAFSLGGSVAGSIAMITALNSADDLFFSAMDVAGGYKTAGEAGFSFGKQVVNNAISAAGSVFMVNPGIGELKLVPRTLVTGANTLYTGSISSFVSSMDYDRHNGFSINTGIQMQGIQGAAAGALTGMTSTFTSGFLNDSAIFGFTDELLKDGRQLNGLVGGLAGQGVNYALGNDFTLNVLNIGPLFKEGANAGILELNLGRNGTSFSFGSGGADVSIGTLRSAARGLEAYKVNIELYKSRENHEGNYVAMRTLYTGSEVNKKEYDNIIAGKTLVRRWDEEYTKSKLNRATGVKTIFLGTEATGSSSRLTISAFLSHESYRDGKFSGIKGQRLELQNAVLGHIETNQKLIDNYGRYSLDRELADEALAFRYFMENDPTLIQSIFKVYDNSGDNWRLLRDGTVVDDGSGWLTYESGLPVMTHDKKPIGADDVTEGLLNILFGGTSNRRYASFNDREKLKAETLMTISGIISSENGSLRPNNVMYESGYWGLALNMDSLMNLAGDTVAAQVFAFYYTDRVNTHLALEFGRTLVGQNSERLVPSIARERFDLLLDTTLSFYKTGQAHVDLSLGYYISGLFRISDESRYHHFFNWHHGIDLSRVGGPSEDPVFAGLSGMITDIDWNFEANGHSVRMEYGFNFEGVFIGTGIYGESLHLYEKSSFIEGDFVSADTQIGRIGGTPNYAPHLHQGIITYGQNFSASSMKMLMGYDYRDIGNWIQSRDDRIAYNLALYYSTFLGQPLRVQ